MGGWGQACVMTFSLHAVPESFGLEHTSLFLVTAGLSQGCSLYVKPAGGSRASHQGCEDKAGRQDKEQGWTSGSDGDSPCPNLQVRVCLGMNQTPAPQELFCFATHELM